MRISCPRCGSREVQLQPKISGAQLSSAMELRCLGCGASAENPSAGAEHSPKLDLTMGVAVVGAVASVVMTCLL